jgi:hypothetical protein
MDRLIPSKDQAKLRLTHISAKVEFPEILLLLSEICLAAHSGYYVL